MIHTVENAIQNVARPSSVTSIRKDNSILMVRRKGMAPLTVGILGLLSLCANVAGQCDPSAIFLDVNPAYDVGFNPHSIASDDLDGDGVPDLAVASRDSNNVSVLMGNGDGIFASYVAYDVGVFPRAIAIGDLDGDGVPDLVTANIGTNDVSVLLGNGDGTFASHVTYAAGDTPVSIAIGDLNGDGIPDLAVANYSSKDVSVLLNQCKFTNCPADLDFITAGSIGHFVSNLENPSRSR